MPRVHSPQRVLCVPILRRHSGHSAERLAMALEIAEGEVAAVADAQKPVIAALAIWLAGAFETTQES